MREASERPTMTQVAESLDLWVKKLEEEKTRPKKRTKLAGVGKKVDPPPRPPRPPRPPPPPPAPPLPRFSPPLPLLPQPLGLKDASTEQKGDKSYVLRVLGAPRSRRYGAADRDLEFASEKLQADKQVVRLAVIQNPHNMQFASEELLVSCLSLIIFLSKRS